MKKLLLLTAFMLAFVGFSTQASAQKKQETVSFKTTIHCHSCQMKIEDSVPFERGVKDVKVDVPSKVVTITYDPAKTTPETLRHSLEKLGYQAELLEPDNTPANIPAEPNTNK